MWENYQLSLVEKIVLSLVTIILIPAFVITMVTYPDYSHYKNDMVHSNTVKDIISADGELRKELDTHIASSEVGDRLYDIAILDKDSVKYLEWLVHGHTQPVISSIYENTEILEMDNLYTTSEIVDGFEAYSIGDLKFLKNEDSAILTDTNTSIKIEYAKDQKKDGVIKDYTVVYQKKK